MKSAFSTRFLLASFAFLLSITAPAQAQERVLRKEVAVDASLKEVWNAFTSNEGAETFFAPKTNIFARLGGAYEVYFYPMGAGPDGVRGCEAGCRIQSIVPMKSLAFTWSAEPDTKTLRATGLTTIVYLRFKEFAPRKTLVEFTNVGWGEGDEWDHSYNAFDRDWGVVLGRLKIRFEKGPIDWSNPPKPTETYSVTK
jgi:uncharacterized protein YndB with AHSA1/START domain